MSKPKRDDKSVKMDRKAAERAAFIARVLGYGSLAEYLTVKMAPHIEADWPKAKRKHEELDPKKGE